MKTTFEKIENLVQDFDKNNNTDLGYILRYQDFKHLDLEDFIKEFEGEVVGNCFLDIEVIYYSNAIKILQEQDSSLKYSLELAQDLGYTIENINSELLASLLLSEQARENFYKLIEELRELED